MEKMGDVFRMDFPSWPPNKINEYPEELQKALGVDEIVGVYKNRDLIVELQDENAVKKCKPDFTLLKKIGEKVIITAPANTGEEEVDFVSRFFAPSVGINEDAGFVRIHKSCLVNLLHVKEYIRGEGGSVKLSDKTELEVARRKKDVLLSRMKEFYKF